MRILTVAHNHSSFHPGGTEVVAESLHARYAERGRDRALLLAGVDPTHRGAHPGTALQALPDRDDVLLVRIEGIDIFRQIQTRFDTLLFDLKPVLTEFRPEVVHIHHLNGVGIEFLTLVRRLLPDCVIVYTLHDYYLICPHDGLMVKTKGDRLCPAASPDACHGCFPTVPPMEFQMRERHLRRHLDVVDAFAAPSAFIRDRFVAWGIPEEKIRVIRNGRSWPKPSREGTADRKTRNRFGIFGNLRATKGTLVAAEAAVRLVESGFEDFSLDLHGEALFQPDSFTDALRALVDRSDGRIRCRGQYRQDDLPHLMNAVDWVMVPSTWWENAPLAIGDAFSFGKPVLCSDIGGMAEAVADGADGLHVRCGDVDAWAETMRRAVEDQGLWSRLSQGIRLPQSVDAMTANYLDLFAELAAERARPPVSETSRSSRAARSKAGRPARPKAAAAR